MIHLRRIWPCLVAAGLVVSSSGAFAQSEAAPEVSEEMLKESHDITGLDPPAELRNQIESLVKKRQAEQYQKIFELLKQQKMKPEDAVKDPSFLKGLADNKALGPELRQLIEQFADPQHAPPLTPETLEKLEKQFKEFVKDPRAENPAENKDTTPSPSPPSAEPDEGEGGNSFFDKLRRGTGSGSEPAGQVTEKGKEYAERFVQWLSGSPAMRKAMRDLGRRIGPDDPRWGKLSTAVDTLSERFRQSGLKSEWERLLGAEGVTGMLNSIPESLPQFGPGGGEGSGTSIDKSGGPFAGSAVPVLALAGFACLAALFAWWLGRERGLVGGRRQPEWVLGPWPVNPDQVASRTDFVQAFEYLSLLQLGPEARSWNHRTIQTRLANPNAAAKATLLPEPKRRRTITETGQVFDDPLRPLVVGELASLYEQARYAPPADILSDEALRTARRDLCLLAGVSSA
jgi:hypothetical protein